MRPRGQNEDGEKEHSYSASPQVEGGKVLGLCVKLHVCFCSFLKALHIYPVKNVFAVFLTRHWKGGN